MCYTCVLHAYSIQYYKPEVELHPFINAAYAARAKLAHAVHASSEKPDNANDAAIAAALASA